MFERELEVGSCILLQTELDSRIKLDPAVVN